MPRRIPRAVTAAYLVAVALLAAGAFLPPSWRTWGVSVWGHAPRALAGIALIVALAAPGFVVLVRREPTSPRVVRIAALIALAIAFWLFRTHAHFLGDGYQNLSRLGLDHVFPKTSSRGTVTLLVALRDLFGGGESAALAAYRTVAIASGVAFLALVVAAARHLVDLPAHRPGFVAILATCGTTLLFYGYVENYALLALATAAHALHGVHVARTGRGRWIATVIVAVAVASHVFGALLVPSLVRVLLGGTEIARRLRRVPATVRFVLPPLAAVAAIALLGFARERSLTLDFALVPFRTTRFTVDGYTLLSAAHLMDLANLAFLLLPGGLVLGVALAAARSAWVPLRRDPAVPFLATLVVFTSGAVGLLDPRLGMPRDWDLFSFAGIPWAVAAALAWDAAAKARHEFRIAAPLAALLGALVLAGRLSVLADPERAVVAYRDMLDLDHAKGRNGRYLIVQHHRRSGREDAAQAEIEAWNRDYPERGHLEKGRASRAAGDLEDAVRWFQIALHESPQYADAHNNLADVLLSASMPDEAARHLRIALALNPDEYAMLTNLGTAELMREDPEAAERAWRRALAVDPAGFHANRNLAHLLRRAGRYPEYERRIARAAASPDASGDVLAEWAEVLDGRGNRPEALRVLARARARGLSVDVEAGIRERHPDWFPPDDPSGPHPVR